MGVQACRERGVSLLELVFTLAAAATGSEVGAEPQDTNGEVEPC